MSNNCQSEDKKFAISKYEQHSVLVQNFSKLLMKFLRQASGRGRASKLDPMDNEINWKALLTQEPLFYPQGKTHRAQFNALSFITNFTNMSQESNS